MLHSGFLTTGDNHAPGNYGLLDQVAALHWLADNIQAFGGDPTEITLMGQDFGATLVNLLMTSPIISGSESKCFTFPLLTTPFIHGAEVVTDGH